MYSMIRTQLRSLSIEQAQYVNKPTTEVYLDFAKANNFEPVTVELGNGAKAHWVGDKNAKISLVFLHGMARSPPPFPHSKYDLPRRGEPE
jgi:hypothetical protein